MVSLTAVLLFFALMIGSAPSGLPTMITHFMLAATLMTAFVRLAR